MDDGEEPGQAQRLDKWLWHARLLKTRGLASRLISGGMVRVNREKVHKPAYTIRPGDVITAAIVGRVRVVRVIGICDRRGPPSEASALYDDILGDAPSRAADDAATSPMPDMTGNTPE